MKPVLHQQKHNGLRHMAANDRRDCHRGARDPKPNRQSDDRDLRLRRDPPSDRDQIPTSCGNRSRHARPAEPYDCDARNIPPTHAH